MSDQKLTPWFPAHIKPARPGVYFVKGAAGMRGYAYWSGRLWGWRLGSAQRAAEQQWGEGADQFKTWCGLAKEPK